MEGRLFRGLEEPRKVEGNLGVVGPCGINQRRKGTMKLYVEASSSSAGTRPLRLSSPFHISLRRSRQLSSQRGLKIRYYQRMAVYDWPQSLNVGISSSGDKTLAHDWDVLGTSRCYSNGVRKAGRRTPVVARTELESYTRFRAPLNLGRMQPDATGRAFLPPREDVEGFSKR